MTSKERLLIKWLAGIMIFVVGYNLLILPKKNETDDFIKLSGKLQSEYTADELVALQSDILNFRDDFPELMTDSEIERIFSSVAENPTALKFSTAEKYISENTEVSEYIYVSSGSITISSEDFRLEEIIQNINSFDGMILSGISYNEDLTVINVKLFMADYEGIENV